MSPYVTLIILECTATDGSAEIARLGRHLESLVKSRKGLVREVLATTGARRPDSDDASQSDIDGTAEDGAILYVERGQPSWMNDGPLEDVHHSLAVWFSRERFVAIRADGSLADAIQSWLDKSPRPQFRRIQPRILQGEFFQGEIKNLWLKGVHPRRSTMADSKYLSGPRLQDALSPLTDASFAPSAGKADLALNSAEPDVLSKVGCTPAKSSVWVKRAADFSELRSLALAVLDLVASAVARGAATSTLPWLAVRQDGLSGVHSAFELVASSADEVGPGGSPELLDAALTLEGAELQVKGDPSSANFTVDVGLAGRIGGTVACSATQVDGRVRLSFGVRGTPTDECLVKPIRDALQFTELLTVHYESGHAVTDGAAWTSPLASAAFPRWVWHDFTGWTITAEKPDIKPALIHSQTGSSADRSLFSWVADHFDEGYLACDDGPGEVADFVHLDHDDTLSLIHVKAASSNHPKRGIAAQRYEAVIGQALKNVVYLDPARLRSALGVTREYPTACWLDGRRLADRVEMLEYLGARSRTATSRVVVLQPHVRMEAHRDSWSQQSAKVRLLDALLNAARGTVTGLGAEFEVWGAK
jgi:hypothetical protein